MQLVQELAKCPQDLRQHGECRLLESTLYPLHENREASPLTMRLEPHDYQALISVDDLYSVLGVQEVCRYSHTMCTAPP